MKKQNGIIAALFIFILPTVTFTFLAYYSGAFEFDDLTRLLGHPVSLAMAAAVLAASIIFIIRNYRIFKRFMADPDPDRVESIQKRLIGFPKKLLIGGLLYGLIIPQLILFLLPQSRGFRIDFLCLGYANTVFMSVPSYIIFIQRIEKWGSSIPFSTEHLSMKLNVRVNLVSTFVLTSMLCILAITVKNTMNSLTGLQNAFRIIGLRSLPILFIGLLGGILDIYLLMRGISNRLSICREYSQQMAGGDISMGELDTISRDELGSLTAEMSHVYRNMNELIGSVKTSVQSTIAVKDNVVEVANSITSTVSQITGNISLVDTQFENLDSHVTGTIQSVESLNANIGGLNGEILKQTSMVEESTASITEMIASVENIARISNQKMEGVGALQKVSGDGSKKLSNTITRLKEIGDSIKQINEVTGIIQSISAQTNLLAMNAAIEAAHAGEAGRGFAVVADEIRKLAETSANNSKHISDSIKTITAVIDEAVISGDSTSESFDEISREITDVSNSFMEISSGVDELKAGGEHVLQAVTALKDISLQVKGNSDSMQNETGKVRDSMEGLKKLSTDTRQVTQEMNIGIETVGDDTKSLDTHTRNLDETTRDVENQINRFQT